MIGARPKACDLFSRVSKSGHAYRAYAMFGIPKFARTNPGVRHGNSVLIHLRHGFEFFAHYAVI